MAIFDWSLQTVQRSAGDSAVAMAAYRSGNCLRDHRTGVEHDFTHRRNIYAEIVMPEDVTAPALDNPNSRSELRSRLWNAAEGAEGRKNSVTAREILVALPHELPRDRRLALARAYAGHIARRFGVVVDIAVHPPSRAGDRRNWHCHMLFTTRRVGSGFAFGPKTRELDAAATGGPIIKHLREKWADFVNLMLMDVGSSAAIDHRSLADRGITRAPDRHIGPQATNLARKLRSKAARLVKEAADLERDALTVLWPRPALAEVLGEAVGWEDAWVAHARVAEQAAREASARAEAAEKLELPASSEKAAARPEQASFPTLHISIIEEGDITPIVHRVRPMAANAAPAAHVPDLPVVRPVTAAPVALPDEVGPDPFPTCRPVPEFRSRPAGLRVDIVDEGDIPDDILAAAVRAAAEAKAERERGASREDGPLARKPAPSPVIPSDIVPSVGQVGRDPNGSGRVARGLPPGPEASKAPGSGKAAGKRRVTPSAKPRNTRGGRDGR